VYTLAFKGISVALFIVLYCYINIYTLTSRRLIKENTKIILVKQVFGSLTAVKEQVISM